MGTRNTVVPVPEMRVEDYRDPRSFVNPTYLDMWADFLKRWNDPSITTDEARGLLHTIADRRLSLPHFAFFHMGEDSRETCVRFLLHYAGRSYVFDDECQIICKAREVLVNKVLESIYMREEAGDRLVEDVLNYFLKDKNERVPSAFGGGRRKLEEFLRMINETRDNPEIRELVDTLVGHLFRSKNKIANEQRRGRS